MLDCASQRAGYLWDSASDAKPSFTLIREKKTNQTKNCWRAEELSDVAPLRDSVLSFRILAQFSQPFLQIYPPSSQVSSSTGESRVFYSCEAQLGSPRLVLVPSSWARGWWCWIADPGAGGFRWTSEFRTANGGFMKRKIGIVLPRKNGRAMWNNKN